MQLRALLVGINCAAFSACSYANEQLETLPSLPSSPAYLLKLVLGLIAVISLFSALAWLIRRFGMGGFSRSSSGELRILETLSLGSRERLVIVQAGKNKLLLGITAGKINKLHTLELNQENRTNFEDHLNHQREKV